MRFEQVRLKKQADYESKMKAREESARKGKKPRERNPNPPENCVLNVAGARGETGAMRAGGTSCDAGPRRSGMVYCRSFQEPTPRSVILYRIHGLGDVDKVKRYRRIHEIPDLRSLMLPHIRLYLP